MTYMQAELAFLPAQEMASPLSRIKVAAIDVGLSDGRQESARWMIERVLRKVFGAKDRPLANASLETLRAFGKLATVVGEGGRQLSLALLEANGFSSIQIAAAFNIATARLTREPVLR
ncbi:hypothetical protein [Sphingomonas adhaesiva]|uniref:hypothetical protein n=1 Tax=Sphingomonas adhaesiva TaxID=28212 RepID=UPI002FF9DD94